MNNSILKFKRGQVAEKSSLAFCVTDSDNAEFIVEYG